MMKSILDIFKVKNKHNHNNEVKNSQKGPIKKHLNENFKIIKQTLGKSSDLVIREIHVGEDGDKKIGIIFIDGLANKMLIQDFIIRPLTLDIRISDSNISSNKNFFDFLKDNVIPNGEMGEISNFEDLFKYLLSGDSIILIDGLNKGFMASSKGWESRNVTEPNAQTVIRGPKDGFTESLRTNTALIRRRIKDSNLWIETKQVGRVTKTDVSIAFINGIAHEDIVNEVRSRIDKIDIDGILEGGYIEELIRDEPYTPFPTIYNSERPDVIAAGLLEGRIAIIVDGTPFVLLVPALFVQFFQSAEDYYHHFDISTLVRILRFIAFFSALLTPSLYIALTSFHQEMIPTPLLISIAAQREGVPFPIIIEALLMEFTFEILREAGVRMPKAVGAAISIVGALVLGEAAVQAGVVSSITVIVVSFTAITSFVSPTYNMSIAVRILRFAFMLLAATFGLYGITLGAIVMVLHLCSIRSFGIPYMTPLAPFNLDNQKDSLVRFPWWKMIKRPRLLNQTNIKRQQNSKKAKPTPPPPEFETENINQ